MEQAQSDGGFDHETPTNTSTQPTYSDEVMAQMRFTLSWSSDGVKHTDVFAHQSVNAWRDFVPTKLETALTGKVAGDKVTCHFKSGELIGLYDPALVKTIPLNAIDEQLIPNMHVAADFGRYFPQAVIHRVGNIYNIYRQTVRPMRILEHVENDKLKVDLNHPFSSLDITLSADIEDLYVKESDGGGPCVDWAEELSKGVGMQARAGTQETDFFYDGAQTRKENSLDSEFYAVPRMVVHLDDTALKNVSDLYGRFLKDDMVVLDLMSSMRSHIPEQLKLKAVTGLGMNQEELHANPQLSDFLVHDLNADPVLPCPDNKFDACICTVSVEYLTDPVAVFKQVAKTLKTGAPFILTFSHRWFPPKVIKIWEEMHPFERIGYVLECMHRSEAFENLESWSIQGMPRPEDDSYCNQDPNSDPVFAVWGYKT